jgi:hypothetical protein
MKEISSREKAPSAEHQKYIKELCALIEELKQKIQQEDSDTQQHYLPLLATLEQAARDTEAFLRNEKTDKDMETYRDIITVVADGVRDSVAVESLYRLARLVCIPIFYTASARDGTIDRLLKEIKEQGLDSLWEIRM